MRNRRTRPFAIPGLLIGAGLALLAGGPVVLAESGIHRISSEVCETCHQDIYRQWQGSMHAQSTALKDPIHGTFYKMEVGDPTAEGQVHQKSGTFPVCLHCHAPNASRDKTTKLDALPAYSEGVNCVACHTLQDYKGMKSEDGKLRYGITSYTLSDELQGPKGFQRGVQQLQAAADELFGGIAESGADSQKPNPHLGEPVEMDGKLIPALTMNGNPVLMRTSDACMGCHDQRANPQGVPLCQTGDEFVASGSEVVCQSCHMPMSGGIPDHSMGGGHSPQMLERAAVFSMTSEADGEVIKTRVRIQNLQPHALPTGAPFRNLYMTVAAYDAEGEIIWRSNPDGHPETSDPQAYFYYGLADDEGKPAPPPTATQPGVDTRLQPHEVREINYEIPAEGVALVRAELYYNLMWQSLVKRFDHLPEELTRPVLMASAENAIDMP